MSKRAIVLAGGKGQRLRPYTVVLPKPLMPIGEYPIVEVVIRQLCKNGFDHVTLAVNHQAELIKTFFGDGSKWGIKIDYSLEDRPLSTMGPLHLIKDLPEDFLIINGDVLSDISFRDLYDYHVSNGNMFTISSYMRQNVVDYGVLDVDSAQKLSGFREKPTHSYQVSMGLYIANRSILDIIPGGQPYGFDHLMSDMLKVKRPVDVRCFDGIWLDIGRPDDYMAAIDLFEKEQERFLPNE